MIIQSPWALLWSWVRLHRGGYQNTLGHINRLSGSVTPAAKHAETAKETAFALAVATRAGPWWPQCLTRSLALARLLKRRGIPCVIRIGLPAGTSVNQQGKPVAFSAHAWVEHDHIVLNDRPDIASRFSAFDTESGPA